MQNKLMADETLPNIPEYPLHDNPDVFKRRRLVVGAVLGVMLGTGVAGGIGYVDDHYIDLSDDMRRCAATLNDGGSDQTIADECFGEELEDIMNRTYASEDDEFKLIYHLDKQELAAKAADIVNDNDNAMRYIRTMVQVTMIALGGVLGAFELMNRGRRLPKA